jgi:lipoprotein-anchoring transpeptidase ErfK/SrfK
MGLLYRRQGKVGKAVKSFKDLLDMFPDDRQAKEAANMLGELSLNYALRESSIQHRVKRGESLELISRKYDSTPYMISKASNLKSNLLRIDQTLNVPCPEFTIEVDLTDKLLFLKYKGLIVRTYQVGVGSSETPTPAGDFTIKNQLVDPPWYSPDGYVPAGDPKNELGSRWMGIVSQEYRSGYGIHGTIDPDSIGKAESKGCIRMHNVAVEELFGLVNIGTSVQVREKIEDRSWYAPVGRDDVSSG